MGNTPVYFDKNGNPPTGYDIICWVWMGSTWTVREVGAFRPNPIELTVNDDLIEWYNTGEPGTVRTLWNFGFLNCLLCD